MSRPIFEIRRLVFYCERGCLFPGKIQNAPDIAADAKGPILELLWDVGLLEIDTDIGGVRVVRSHAPEGIFDDPRGVIPHAEL